MLARLNHILVRALCVFQAATLWDETAGEGQLADDET